MLLCAPSPLWSWPRGGGCRYTCCCSVSGASSWDSGLLAGSTVLAPSLPSLFLLKPPIRNARSSYIVTCRWWRGAAIGLSGPLCPSLQPVPLTQRQLVAFLPGTGLYPPLKAAPALPSAEPPGLPPAWTLNLTGSWGTDDLDGVTCSGSCSLAPPFGGVRGVPLSQAGRGTPPSHHSSTTSPQRGCCRGRTGNGLSPRFESPGWDRGRQVQAPRSRKPGRTTAWGGGGARRQRGP